MTVPTDFLTPELKKEFYEKCSSASCQDAVGRLVNARNAFAANCNNIAVWNNLRNVDAALAASLFAAALAAAVAAAAATATIIPFAIILWAAAAVFLAAALVLSALAINAAAQYGNAQRALTNAQGEFTAALADAREKCGPYCNIGDQRMPRCP